MGFQPSAHAHPAVSDSFEMPDFFHRRAQRKQSTLSAVPSSALSAPSCANALVQALNLKSTGSRTTTHSSALGLKRVVFYFARLGSAPSVSIRG